INEEKCKPENLKNLKKEENEMRTYDKDEKLEEINNGGKQRNHLTSLALVKDLTLKSFGSPVHWDKVRRYRSGKSLGNVSPSSFFAQLIPGDMSLGKRIPSDKSPGIPLFCRWGKWQLL
ncbi:hypothetical protein Tco_0309143, partial [Tanacetum coccineum]